MKPNSALKANVAGQAAGGYRQTGAMLRHELEERLDTGLMVAVDFTGVEANQPLFDELVGVLVLKRGPGIMQQMTFNGCSDKAKSMLDFVAATRAADHCKRIGRSQ